MTALVDVEVESIAAGGDGVARAAGLVVFLPRTAPGDAGSAAIESRGRFARGELRELTRRSALRVDPPCPHYTRDRCGGCQLQHIEYAGQLDAKQRIVQDSLARIGRREVPLPTVVPSPNQWRYRRKLTLAMRRRDRAWVAGLHPYDAPDRVFALDDCPITDERVLDAWREVLDAAAHLPRARALRGAVRLVEGGASLVVEGGTEWRDAQRFLAATPSIVTLWWGKEGVRPGLVRDRRPVRTPAASFVQVNPRVAEMMREHVVRCVRRHAPATVVDAYAGEGDTAAALADAGSRVTAIELDPEAARWCATRLPPGSQSLVGRVEDILDGVLPADVVILNPPRRGVHERVTAALASVRPLPRAVLYVSCNPATLARDVARLPGFAIASIQAFDMFPQTAHVETVCELVPEAS